MILNTVMQRHFRFAAAFAGLLVAMAAAPAALANHPATNPYYGTPMHQGPTDRTIVIDASTKWVNVTDGETIRFVTRQPDGQKSFVWRFDTYAWIVFDLARIAPAGMLGDRSIEVYVATNPQDV